MNTADYIFTLYALPPLAVGTLMLIFGLSIFFKERASSVGTAFLATSASVAAWLIFYGVSYMAVEVDTAFRWVAAAQIGVCFIPSTVFIFALTVVQLFPRLKVLAWLTLATSTVFAFLILISNRFLIGLHSYAWGYYARYGDAYNIFLIYFFSLMIGTLLIFWIGHHQALPEMHRKRLRIFFAAFCVAYAGALDYLPAYGVDFYPIGFFPILCFFILSSYAISKYHLVDVTPSFAAKEIIAALPDVLVVVDCEGVVRVVNEAACRVLERNESEIVGKSILSVENSFLTKSIRESLLKEKENRNYELTLCSSKGLLTSFSVSASIAQDRSGRPAAIVLIARDITESKKSKAELQNAYAELKRNQNQLIQAEKLQSIGQLAAGVAHEVKNPLAVIYQGLEYVALKLGDRDKNLSSICKDMTDAVERADLVIRGMVDFSAPREVILKEEDLNSILEKSLLLVQHELKKNHISIIQKLDPHLPHVRLDRNKIEQVFINVFTNAAQAIGESGGSLTVRTYTKQTDEDIFSMEPHHKKPFGPGDRLVIAEVDDTGPGIPEHVLKKIFDPFYTTKQQGKGTGLGLSVTQKIMELHNGMIFMANREGGGARSTIVFKI